MGLTSKGEAVKRVSDVFLNHCNNQLLTMGLGDSENDLSMLSAVDRPVLVKRWDGSWLERDDAEGYTKTVGIGPAGWNEAVRTFLAEDD